jgi:Collagen triple helix repeat (20 copies)
MIKRIGEHCTPATAISLIALVLAVTGGAFAATGSGGSSHGRFLATASKTKAKPKTKPGPRGPAGKNGTNGTNGAPGAQGPAGPTGPTGPAGGTGPAGNNGTNGTDGTNGTSPTVKEVKTTESACNKQGGSEIASGTTKTYACNGKTGFTETLPPGKTETGTWVTEVNGEPVIPISFPIPLAGQPLSTEGCEEPEGSRAKPCQVHYVPLNQEVEGCKGGTSEEPTAEPGNLCVFSSRLGFDLKPPVGASSILVYTAGGEHNEHFGGPGVLMIATAEGLAAGSYAVTAPTE